MTLHSPIPDHKAAREAMIDSQLRPQGVNDPAVLAAMRSVERELYVPEGFRAVAYMDRSIPLGGGRSMAAPSTLGLLLTQLAPKAGERALVIGGTGYAAAVLKRIGADVSSVEEDASIAAIARENGIDVTEGPLAEGDPKGAPYDILFIDGAVEEVPQALVDQLREGGRCGTGLAGQGIARLAVGRKSAGKLGFYTISDAGMGRLPGFEKPRTFRF